MGSRRMTGLLGALLASALVAMACGGGATGAGDAGGEDGLAVIRFAFAPDPVWDHLNDSGIREEMEREAGIVILDSATWDEFGIYAGGHADIVSVGSFEVPLLEEETGQPGVIFGKYNIDRSIVVVPADSDAQTLADLRGGKIAVWDAVSSTVIWGVLAKALHDVDFRTGGGDFELVLADITNTGELAARKEVDGALVLPDFNIAPLLEERVRILYDGRTSADLYSEIIGEAHEGPMINIFLARKEWFESHPEEVAFFLDVWERGLQEWFANKDLLIENYPQHFAAEGDEQVAFIKEYLEAHDWFATSVYLDEAWVERESRLFQLMRENGFLEQDDPEFVIVSP